jgi:RNA-binding protein YhbY
MIHLAKFQLGKNGLTEGVMKSLTLVLKNHKQVRISVLKSCCRGKENLNEIARKLEMDLPYRLRARTIGYTIVLIKLSENIVTKPKKRVKAPVLAK